MTCPKTQIPMNFSNSNNESENNVVTSQSLSSSTEISQEDKDKVSELMKMLGISE